MVALRLKRYFFDHRLRAILLLCCALFLTLSLSSYNVDDPSLNTASKNVPSNVLGYTGSYIADILLQACGWSNALLLLSLYAWSIVLFTKRTLTFHIFRILSLIASILLFSALLGTFDFKFIPAGLGGLLGSFGAQYLIGIDVALLITLWCLAVIFFVVSTGYDKQDLIGLMNKLHTRANVMTSSAQMDDSKNIKKPLSYESLTGTATQNTNAMRLKTQPASNVHSNEDFILPTIDLLGQYNNQSIEPTPRRELEQNAEDLLQVLSDFGVKGKILDINQGPVVTLYEFEPSAGTKSSRVIGLADDIARSLSAVSTRIAVIPGRNALGIELPNEKREFFSLSDLICTDDYIDSDFNLPIILGKDLAGKPAIVDLAKMPHLLVAGTTGSGKSVAINAMIISLLYKHSPETCKFIMIDPKMLELSVYDGIPHLLTPVVTEPGKAVVALKWAVKEMENRYRLMSNLGVRNIAGYNERMKDAVSKGQQLERTAQTGFDPDTGKPIYESVPIEMENLPFIVIIVDEMADLMIVAGKDIEGSIQRLAQMARAAGIHIIMATQRPSVDVITGVIKANFPSRVSFKVTSKIDSRTILGEQGAEQLLGMGDMLYMGSNSKIARFHGPFVDDREVENITQFLKAQSTPEYITGITESDDDMSANEDGIMLDTGTDDESLYRQALQIVQRDRKVSTSYVQRCLRIGYNRAALIIERMEREGAVSAPNHSGKREILLNEN